MSIEQPAPKRRSIMRVSRLSVGIAIGTGFFSGAVGGPLVDRVLWPAHQPAADASGNQAVVEAALPNSENSQPVLADIRNLARLILEQYDKTPDGGKFVGAAQPGAANLPNIPLQVTLPVQSGNVIMNYYSPSTISTGPDNIKVPDPNTANMVEVSLQR